jgi:hypothetical protein
MFACSDNWVSVTDLTPETASCALDHHQGGRAVHWGGTSGYRTGEGPSAGDVPRHTITIRDPHGNQTVTVEVPEDR